MVTSVFRSLSIILILVGSILGQDNGATNPPAIILGRSVMISTDNPSKPHAESFLALNPKDPSRMLATAIVYENGSNTSSVYVSRDGGRTWQRAASFEKNIPPLGGGDPTVYFDSIGAALFSSIGSEGFRLWRSVDAGGPWDSSVRVPGGIFDRQYLAVDLTSGIYAGRIYAAGAVVVQEMDGRTHFVLGTTSSTDNGETFTPTRFLDTRSGSYALRGIADIVITKDGKIVIPFEATPLQAGTREVASLNTQIWTVVSEDGGRTFSVPRPGPKIGYGPLGFRATKVSGTRRSTSDNSDSPFANRIYVTWVDFTNNRYDIKVAYSNDSGSNWSVPVAVNDNVGGGDPSNPAIAVNRDGVLAVIWNDRRDDLKNECYRLYLSASLDGGETFLPNIKVDPNPTCPSAPGNWPGTITSGRSTNPNAVRTTGNRIVNITGAPERFQNGGETQGLVAGPDGRFHAAWINGASGVMQLWYTDFTVNLGGQKVGRQRIDRTADVAVETGEPVIDFESKTLSFSVRLKNESQASISGPLTLVADQVQSGLGGLTAANADNGLLSTGAAWTFGRSLAPGELSETRQLRWIFDGRIPTEPTHRFLGQFRIFSQPDKVEVIKCAKG